MINTLILIATLLPVVSTAQGLLLAGDATSGSTIYEENCQSCHVSQFGGDGSSGDDADPRIVNSIEGLMGQVARCNAMTSAGLDSDQEDDLVAYLNETWYRFE